MPESFRQGRGPSLVSLKREGNLVQVTSRRLGYPITLEITPELLDFLKLKREN